MAPPRCKSLDLTTFDGRVQWAIKNRKICRLPEHDVFGLTARPIVPYDDDELIRTFQEHYENNAQKMRGEEIRRCLEALWKDHPEEVKKKESVLPQKGGIPKVEMQVQAGPSNKRRRVTTPDDDDDIDDHHHQPLAAAATTTTTSAAAADEDENDRRVPRPAAKKKRKQVKVTCGKEIQDPCKECVQRKSRCHEQDPPQTSCYECHKRHKHCSLFPRPKFARPGLPRTSEKTDGETEEEPMLSQPTQRTNRTREAARDSASKSEAAVESREEATFESRIVAAVVAALESRMVEVFESRIVAAIVAALESRMEEVFESRMVAALEKAFYCKLDMIIKTLEDQTPIIKKQGDIQVSHMEMLNEHIVTALPHFMAIADGIRKRLHEPEPGQSEGAGPLKTLCEDEERLVEQMNELGVTKMPIETENVEATVDAPEREGQETKIEDVVAYLHTHESPNPRSSTTSVSSLLRKPILH